MTKLKRELNLFSLTLIGVGIIIGAGIYALIGAASALSGNATWLSFVIAAFIALCTGLSYAELSSMFKGDAGEYDYVTKAINKKFAFFIGLSVIFAGIVTASAVALGFSGYFSSLFNTNYILIALLLLIILTLINFIGIKEVKWANTISTFAEILGLLLILFLGFKFIGSVNYLEMPQGFLGVINSAALVFFAYLGFESIIKLSDETKNPEKTLPKAIILSVIITSILYILIAIISISVIGWNDLSQSQAPLSLVANTLIGSSGGILLAIIALFATANTALVSMVTASRQIYGMAKEKTLPAYFSLVNKKTQTPWIAVILCGVIALIFALIGEITIVADITNLFLFLTFATVNLSLIILRYKSKETRRYFKCPLNIKDFNVIAFLGFISSLIMIFFILRDFIF